MENRLGLIITENGPQIRLRPHVLNYGPSKYMIIQIKQKYCEYGGFNQYTIRVVESRNGMQK